MAAHKPEQTLGLAEKALDTAQKRGANEAEAYVYEGLTTNVVIERGQIAKSSRIIDRGLGVRAIIDKSVGFAYTNILDSQAAIDETVLRALSSARGSRPDEDWQGLPSKTDSPCVKGTYDQKIVELNSEDLVDTAKTLLEAAEKTDKRVFPIEGGAGSSHLCKAVANTNGIEVYEEGTMVECSLATIAKEGGEVTPVCFEFEIERTLDIDPEWVGKEAARLSASALKARKTKTENTSVVFTQFALQQLFGYTLINAVNAENVQRDQSTFRDKLDADVASRALTIHDDGILEGGIRTWRFDDEGVPQQRTTVIKKGVLKNYLYDNYTARKEKKASTGNASRAGYTSTPNIGATNFHITPGESSTEELVETAGEGIIVYLLGGAHSSNPVSGEFSVVATPAWKIEKGEITHAIKGAMLAGSVFPLLKSISGLAKNERKIGQLVAPWVLVENIKVVGK